MIAQAERARKEKRAAETTEIPETDESADDSSTDNDNQEVSPVVDLEDGDHSGTNKAIAVALVVSLVISAMFGVLLLINKRTINNLKAEVAK